MRALIAGLLLFSASLSASPYDPMIDAAAYRHGIDPIVLRAVVQHESKKHPWTFNCDGEGFYFNSMQAAIIALWQISKNPWMVKIRPAAGESIRQFFPDAGRARAFLDAYRAAQYRSGTASAVLRADPGKSVNPGEARIRQLWVVNTDIGIAQVNYRFHGVDKARVQQWFDPYYNLNYAASLIASHKRRSGSDLDAAGDYHSTTPSIRAEYLRKLLPTYKREKARAVSVIAVQ